MQRNKKCVILDNLGMPGHLSTLGMPDYAHPKLYYQLAKNVCLFADKKSTSSHMLFLQYFKDMQTSCFKYFGHAWLHTPKMIVSSCRNVCCLPACHKWPAARETDGQTDSGGFIGPSIGWESKKYNLKVYQVKCVMMEDLKKF